MSEQHECDCKHEGWPRTVTNIAIAGMFASLFLAIGWIVTTAITQ
jgi:hypothetical protein